MAKFIPTVDNTAKIEKLEVRAAQIERRLEALNGPKDTHLEAVGRSFHLGMVGGSGSNTRRLNERRERSLDQTIKNARESVSLNNELARLQAQIKDLKQGGPEFRKLVREGVRKAERERAKAERAAMSPADRLFIGDYPGGYVYADSAVMRNGDYKRLGFRSHTTKQLQFEPGRIMPELREMIEKHAASL